MDVWIEMDVYLSVLIMIISEIGVGTVGTSVCVCTDSSSEVVVILIIRIILLSLCRNLPCRP
jgi:hypothetical protein